MYVTFTSTTYLCLYFIKVILLAPSSVCFSSHISFFTVVAYFFYHRMYVFVFFHVCVCSLLLLCMFKSTALRVGVKTLWNTIPRTRKLFKNRNGPVLLTTIPVNEGLTNIVAVASNQQTSGALNFLSWPLKARESSNR